MSRFTLYMNGLCRHLHTTFDGSFGNWWILLSIARVENFRVSISTIRNTLYSNVFQRLRRGCGLVNRFIKSSLDVTTISSYTLKITETIAHVTSHTKSCNYFSGHTAVPLKLLNSSEVNSHSHIRSYPLSMDHTQKTQFFVVYCRPHRKHITW
jgi:hypothetical protein